MSESEFWQECFLETLREGLDTKLTLQTIVNTAAETADKCFREFKLRKDNGTFNDSDNY